jgi:hypothetical protein
MIINYYTLSHFNLISEKIDLNKNQHNRRCDSQNEDYNNKSHISRALNWILAFLP